MNPLTFTALLIVSATPPSESRALALYNQGKFDKACPLFAAIAESKKNDSAAWGNLGLCEFRRKRTAEGKRASLLAIRYGDAERRKAAAWNLSRYAPLDFEREKLCCQVSCVELDAIPELGCDTKPVVCSQTDGNMGYGFGNWVQERWLFVDVSSGSADAGALWLGAERGDSHRCPPGP